MARDRDDYTHDSYTNSRRKDSQENEWFDRYKSHDSKPNKEETPNQYYNRKQRTARSRLAADDDIYLMDANQDRDAEVDNYKSDKDAGPMNYKKWDKYGGKG